MRPALNSRLSILVLLFSASCVNIYVQFPEAAIENAAEEIVDEVRPEDLGTAPDTGDGVPIEAKTSEKNDLAPAPKTSGPIYSFVTPRRAFALVGSASPEKKSKTDGFKIDIKTPVIQKVIATLKKRYPKLAPWYQRGAVGEGKDGYLAMRPLKGLRLKEKRDLRLLLKQENDDRKTLYTKIAEANRIDRKFVAEIGVTFCKQWQGKSKPGWWIQGKDGKWKKKPKPKKASQAPGD
jgi:uncharacterized protein YdbL (DUF1318 family)